MSLDRDYEIAIIELSAHVLVYLGALQLPRLDYSEGFDMKPYFINIIEADAKCRGFTVIFSCEQTPVGPKRAIEDISDDTDSDDSNDPEDTILGTDEEDRVQEVPSLGVHSKV